MLRQFTIALVLSICCSIPSTWADYQAGVEAYSRDDVATAYREFLASAKQGDAPSQFRVGLLCESGHAMIPQDSRQAVAWYLKAAEQGHAGAQFKLGLKHATGLDLPQDYRQALAWFLKAADQGHAGAQFSLGRQYALGQGTPKDLAQAHKWYSLAGATGNTEATKLRDALAQQLPSEQMAEAQRLAREWKPKK